MKLLDPNLELRMLRTLCDSRKSRQTSMFGMMDADMFDDKTARKIYARMRNLFSAKGDVPSWDELSSDPGLAESAREIIRDRKRIKGFDNSDIESACQQLSTYRKARALWKLSKETMSELDKDEPDVDGILKNATEGVTSAHGSSINRQMLVIGEDGNNAEMMNDILNGKKLPVVPTGFRAFDDKNRGFLKGSLVMLAATTGGGKSTMAHNMMMNMAEAGVKTMLVSLEMSEKSVHGRMLAAASGIEVGKFLYEELTESERKHARRKWNKYEEKIGKVGGRLNVWDPKEGVDIHNVLVVGGMADIDVLFVDYIGLLGGADGEDQWRQLGKTARIAKLWAEKHDRVVVLLAQLSNDGIIKYSRTMQEHADNVWTWVHKKEENEENNVLRVLQSKARNQKAFPMTFEVDFEHMRMTSSSEMAGDGASDESKRKDDKVIDMEKYLRKPA